ncbi:DUF397 domain-containing protein [Actinomadura craniellae]|uniref:DUF397 domain-containing protein n=1 Tax=Actinomadura craniellae TaxID=2231787 RepID=A0A365GYQ4_9ACTN|nr:DUF397 domain-containing protein [Actinomadura craniellae]RAY11974.1 DUF397 domain-containing protein [Actinomadura craniellae]
MAPFTVNMTLWRTSSHSGHQSNCVELAPAPDAVAVRDSRLPAGGVLMFSAAQWLGFVSQVKGGRFDLSRH